MARARTRRPVTAPPLSTMAAAIAVHYRAHRRDLPWRRTRDPYAIWVSEIMLQQTRVATVIPYWQRWMARFPTVEALATAPLDDVLAAWAGLGYYRRARHLHAGAQWVAERGALPTTAAALREVPGIGAYTAGAVASIAHGEDAPLVDGNVARVLARALAIEDDVKSTAGTRAVWAAAAALMAARPAEVAPGELNQGLMELGATVCTPTSPSCDRCPLADVCLARRDARVDELPRLPRRRRADELPLLATTALWIVRGERLLLAQRPATGLYAGLWELPQGGDAADAAAALGVTLVGTPTVVAHHQQVLTHRRLDIAAVAATIRGAPRAVDERYQAVRWATLAEARALGIASGTATLLARLEGTTAPPEARRPPRPRAAAAPAGSRPSGPTGSRRGSRSSAR